MRQTRRPASGVGLGVDASGGPVIDPTENVLSLVDVEKEHGKEIRALESRYQDSMREAESRRLEGLLQAETRRVNDLGLQAEHFETRIAAMNTANAEAKSSLLATQLERMNNSLGDRITDLEKKSWETGGKSAVADPATAEAIKELASIVKGLAGGAHVTEGSRLGQGHLIAMIFGGATFVLAVLGIAAILMRGVGH